MRQRTLGLDTLATEQTAQEERASGAHGRLLRR